jgi:hypothetical protein
MWRINLFFCLFIFSLNALAQEGLAVFYVNTDEGYYEVEINDSTVLKQHKTVLPVGTYSANIWAPGYLTETVNFEVSLNDTTTIVLALTRNSDYLLFEQDYKAYRNQFHKQVTFPVSLTLASSISTGYFMLRAFDTQKDIRSEIEGYYNSFTVNEVDLFKQSIRDKTDRYNRLRSAYYVSGSIAALLVAGTIYSSIHFKRNYLEPKYTEESPFLSKLSFVVTPFGANLTLNL